MNIEIGISACIASYIIASSALIFALLKPSVTKIRWTQALIFLAILLQGYILYLSIDVGHRQNLSGANIFSMITWEAVLLLWVASWRLTVQSLFLLINPLAIISLFVLLFSHGEQWLQTQMEPLLFYHVIFSIMTFSVLALAFAQAIIILLQHKLLRTRHALLIGKLFPPLETMEHLLFLFVYLGFIMLSIIIVASFSVADFKHLSSQIQQKIILAICAWVIFACLCVLRRVFGWQASKAAGSTILGYMILLLSFFGTKLLMHL